MKQTIIINVRIFESKLETFIFFRQMKSLLNQMNKVLTSTRKMLDVKQH